MVLIIKTIIFLYVKDYKKIENTNNICINIFCYQNYLVYTLQISNKNLKIVCMIYY